MTPSNSGMKTKHQFSDFLFFTLLFATCFFTALYSIFQSSVIWMSIYIVGSILLAVVAVKFFCTHCPHYINSGKTVKCMFLWGVPKIFPAQPNTLTKSDKAIALLAFGVIFLAPLYWLVKIPGLLVIYILSSASLIWCIRRYECPRCIYQDCPGNCAPRELRG